MKKRTPANTTKEEPPSIWQKLHQEFAVDDAPGSSAPGLPLSSDSVVVMCGRKKCGKTSALERFISKDKGPGDVPKPTIGVSYNYARADKVVANFYEIGMNLPRTVDAVTSMLGPPAKVTASEMLGVPITAETVTRVQIVACLSLAEPGLVLSSLDGWLRIARDVVQKALGDLQSSGPRGAERVAEHVAARQAAFAEHPDAAMMTPFPVPLTILLTMWDEIEPVEGENRRALMRAIRFAAHMQGATLLAVSTKNEASLNNLRSTFSGSFLAKAQKKEVKLQVNHLQPIFVKPGDDSLEAIGTINGQPPSETLFQQIVRDLFPPPPDDTEDPLKAGDRVLVRNRNETEHDWRPGAVADFERTSGKARVVVDGQERPTTWDMVVKDEETAKYAEPLIDSMVEQKAEELSNYRRQAERAQRMASSTAKGAAM
jgi:dynein light intermediate chain 2